MRFQKFGMHLYSAWPPNLEPGMAITSSPDLNLVTLPPTASKIPARSMLSIFLRGINTPSGAAKLSRWTGCASFTPRCSTWLAPYCRAHSSTFAISSEATFRRPDPRYICDTGFCGGQVRGRLLDGKAAEKWVNWSDRGSFPAENRTRAHCAREDASGMIRLSP